MRLGKELMGYPTMKQEPESPPHPTAGKAQRAAAIIVAANERAKAIIDQATAEAIATLHEADPMPAMPAAAPVEQAPEWGTMGQAAFIRKCTVETMTRHVIEKGLGVKVDGRWRVDLNRVRAWNVGDTSFVPLTPYPCS